MSRFFVGQRVKLVRACDGVSPSDRQAEGAFYGYGITEAGFVFPDGFVNPNECDCYVSWDGLPGPYSQHTNQLEAILPDGHRASYFANVIDLLDSLKRTQRNPDEVAA